MVKKIKSFLKKHKIVVEAVILSQIIVIIMLRFLYPGDKIAGYDSFTIFVLKILIPLYAIIGIVGLIKAIKILITKKKR